MSIKNTTDPERAVLEALQDIVMETMAYPLQRPYDDNSFLPGNLISKAQAALAMYGLQVYPNAHAPKVAA